MPGIDALLETDGIRRRTITRAPCLLCIANAVSVHRAAVSRAATNNHSFGEGLGGGSASEDVTVPDRFEEVTQKARGL